MGIDECNWSQRLESIRKDIECLFVRLKGRWRIFKGTIYFEHRESIDNAWFTACILHNMLHAMDGLDYLDEDADWVGSGGGLAAGEGEGAGDATDKPMNGFVAFRNQLITHYKYASENGDVVWMRRLGV